MNLIGFAIRSLRQSPGFAIVAILALALGIGANSAIFSIVNAIFLRPLPFANPDNLVVLTSSLPERQLENVGFSWPRLLAVKERQQSFSDVAVSIQTAWTATGEGDPEQVLGQQVTQNFFPVLGLQPEVGRNFLPEEDRPGAANVAILSKPFAERRFGRAETALGKSITLDGRPYTVVGVMPRAASRFPQQQTAIWAPRPDEVPFLVREQIDQGGFFYNVLGRLKPGVSVEQAQNDVAAIASAYAQAMPTNVDAQSSADVERFLDTLVGDQAQTYSLLFAAVACVLLIACANVANLALARYSGRRKQIAIRFALGARRRHVMAQLVAENVVLALLGGLVGLGLAALALVAVAQFGANFIPRAEEISLDPTVVAFTLVVSLATGVVLGLIPALQVAKPELTDALKETNRESTGGRRQNRVRSALMVAEVAVSFVLLIAATLLINSFVRVQNVSPGFESEGVFVGQLAVPPTQYPDRSEKLANFYQRLWEGAKAIPGVKAAAINDTPPLAGFGGPSPYAVQGRPVPPLAEQPLALRHIISPDAFATLGVKITQGRDFNVRDTPTSPPVVIINQAMADQLFPGENPIGQWLISGMLQLQQEIVGVVANMHSQNLTQAPQPEMYYPVLQRPEAFTTIMLRTDGDPAQLAGSVRAVLKEVDPTIPLNNATTLATFVEQSMADRRLTMLLLAVFAGLALVLASLGVYSVMAYSVGQRHGEIGVRMAMGAKPHDVERMVIRSGLAQTGIGIAIGLVAALVVTRLMGALLFGIGASDPLTYVAIIVLLAGVAFTASWLPARRAGRVDPLVVMRSE
jgi:putative ABC transport system permease protein